MEVLGIGPTTSWLLVVNCENDTSITAISFVIVSSLHTNFLTSVTNKKRKNIGAYLYKNVVYDLLISSFAELYYTHEILNGTTSW